MNLTDEQKKAIREAISAMCTHRNALDEIISDLSQNEDSADEIFALISELEDFRDLIEQAEDLGDEFATDHLEGAK